MVSEELEFQISQYVDGTLPELEKRALEQRLSGDEEARRLVEEYRLLQKRLSGALPLPQMQWDRIAERISDAIDEGRQPHIAGRIGGWKWAIAASVLLAVGVGVVVERGERPTVKESPAMVEVTGPSAEAASGPVVVDVKVGPSPALAAREGSWRYAEGVVTRPSHIELAGEKPIGVGPKVQ